MEIRKLQLIGGSSYMVSLPKDWIRINELKQGDEIYLRVEDSVITLYPKRFKEEAKIAKVEIEGLPLQDERFIRRYIYALYLQGLDEIIIRDKNINTRMLSRISDIVKNLIGMEIIDASDGIVVLKCLAGTDFDVFGVVKRMTQIIRSMLATLIEALVKNDNEILREIKNLEEDSDRLYLLAVRQEHKLIREYSSPSRWNELRLILGIRTVAKLLEEISDCLDSFSNYLIELHKEKKGLDALKFYIQKLEKSFEMVSDAYFNSNVKLSEDSIRMFEELEDKILKNIGGSVHYRLALESVLSACRHMKSIGEVSFNKAVRESLQKL